MKVSLKWAQELTAQPITAIGPQAVVTKIGQQLGAVEEVTDWGSKYVGAVVARVESCQKHPDADKLSVCLIDDGGKTAGVSRNADGLVQVVCGAPNVKAGMFAVWLTPGSTVPDSIDSEPFVLAAREIRGQISNGMLASLKELALGDSHDGILELTTSDSLDCKLEAGVNFAHFVGLDDTVVDCENKMFTHRPDCFGVLGVARELAGIQHMPFVSPDWYLDPQANPVQSDLALNCSVQDAVLIPRFCAQVIDGVSVTSSPIWLQVRLITAGIRPINSIVDLTNYYMQLTGQPLHAYDYDKVASLSNDTACLIARRAVDGEELTLLSGKKISLDADALVIATDSHVLGLAGIMGGAESEVDDTTTRIILEAATFDMYNIRRSSMRYGVFSDASSRFNKGQSPLQNRAVISKIATHILSTTESARSGELVDIAGSDCEPMPEVQVDLEFVATRLGTQLGVDAITAMLQSVEISVTAQSESGITIQPPFWRRDIAAQEDIVEELARLHGLSNLPVSLPSRSSAPTPNNQLMRFKDEVRVALSCRGANELLTYSFVHQRLLDAVGIDPSHCFHIRNALSPDLQYYRPSLLPSLLDKVHANIKANSEPGSNRFALYEIGKTHQQGMLDSTDHNLPLESERVAFVFAADPKTAAKDYEGAAFYVAANYLGTVTSELRAPVQLVPYTQNGGDLALASLPFEPVRTAAIMVNDELVGYIGEFKAATQRAFKLPEYCAGFEMLLKPLLMRRQSLRYIPVATFPATTKDLTLRYTEPVMYGEVSKAIGAAISELNVQGVKSWALQSIFSGEDGKSFTIRFKIGLSNKTVTTEEANQIVESIADSMISRTGATKG